MSKHAEMAFEHDENGPVETNMVRFPWYEIGEWIAYRTGMCRPNSWTANYADFIFIDCPCCFAVRATSIGFIAGFIVASALAIIF